jgi:hypothetical protein
MALLDEAMWRRLLADALMRICPSRGRRARQCRVYPDPLAGRLRHLLLPNPTVLSRVYFGFD